MILYNLGPTEESVSNNYRKVDQENEQIFSNAVSDQNTLSIYSLNKGGTKTRRCNTKNGITTCENENDSSRPCQGFSFGGNCAGQNSFIDNNIVHLY